MAAGLIATVKLRLLSFHKRPIPHSRRLVCHPRGRPHLVSCHSRDAARAVGDARVSSWRVSLANVVVCRASSSCCVVSAVPDTVRAAARVVRGATEAKKRRMQATIAPADDGTTSCVSLCTLHQIHHDRRLFPVHATAMSRHAAAGHGATDGRQSPCTQLCKSILVNYVHQHSPTVMSSHSLPYRIVPLPALHQQPLAPPVAATQAAIRWPMTWIPACPGVTGGATRCRSVRIRISGMGRCTGWSALYPECPGA